MVTDWTPDGWPLTVSPSFNEPDSWFEIICLARRVADLTLSPPLSWAMLAGTDRDPLTIAWRLAQTGGAMTDLLRALSHPCIEEIDKVSLSYGRSGHCIRGSLIRSFVPSITLVEVFAGRERNAARKELR